jgi:hypothetical protein
VGRKAKRDLDEPDDGKPEHPEEHPGPDRARRRLAREHGSAACVEPEHGQEGDLGEHPVGVQEPLVALRSGDGLAAEELVDRDGSQNEVVGDVGGEEEEGADDERGQDDDRDGDPQNAGLGSGGKRGSTSGERPSSTGEAYG